MTRWLLIVFLTTVSPAAGQTGATLEDINRSFESLARRVGPSIVQILVSGYSPSSGIVRNTGDLLAKRRQTGSGVILDADGYIVTNAHVVEGSQRVQVVLPPSLEQQSGQGSILNTGGRLVGAQLVNIDRESDLAVLKVQAKNLPVLELADSDQLRQGQLVLAFGSPLGLNNSVTMGVISSVARQLESESPMIYIQTDAPINPGNSGGPLVDVYGKVIGINTLIISQSGGSEGIGFASPSNIVRTVFEQIRDKGRVVRGDIGIFAQTIDPLLARALDLPITSGTILGDVLPQSTAEQAGLKAGDIVLALGGKRMENGRQLTVNLYQRPVGERVLMQVVRGPDTLEVSVEVVNRANDPGRFTDFVNADKNLIPELGVLALDLNERLARMFPDLRISTGVVVAGACARCAFLEWWIHTGRHHPPDQRCRHHASRPASRYRQRTRTARTGRRARRTERAALLPAVRESSMRTGRTPDRDPPLHAAPPTFNRWIL